MTTYDPRSLRLWPIEAASLRRNPGRSIAYVSGLPRTAQSDSTAPVRLLIVTDYDKSKKTETDHCETHDGQTERDSAMDSEQNERVEREMPIWPGKANRNVIPNAEQCWPLQYKPSEKAEWRIHSVHLTYRSVDEAKDDLREKSREWGDTNQPYYTRHGSHQSPTHLVGGEHVRRNDE